jgi:hypothetical protein
VRLRRGGCQEIYESQVRYMLRIGSRQRKSKKVIMAKLWQFAYRQRCTNDIETGAFEVADDLLAASKRLSARVPDAQTWFIRIGHSAVDHFGARSLSR